MSEPSRKPRGPKPRPRAEVKRNSITFRALSRLRDQLMVAAGQNGRSLSEEVESRLEQSLGDPSPFGSPEIFALMVALAFRVREMERRFESPWLEIKDPRFHAAMGRAMEEHIVAMQADLDLQPLTRAEAERYESQASKPVVSDEERAARGATMIEGERWLSDDDDLPSDPADGEPVPTPMGAHQKPPKRDLRSV